MGINSANLLISFAYETSVGPATLAVFAPESRGSVYAQLALADENLEAAHLNSTRQNRPRFPR